ncbi:hypothetical protein BAX94_11290 [Elizabethkingia meningoseptica]|uniref:Uncharacterized protein n=1 Tax=Elizabethkingia meningoseptica TaxID=238 RepID=A0A1V3TW10_ELIME|nr:MULTISPECIES: hypothetical protein [Elizabethkingia]AQX04396.1 hypothetical protein BBD33_03640 [Elizabethkingia meningoseptica]AQX11861.1 hypothetical protein BBD35_05475 [Elizabethkingia meningoseptica]AQX46437.1 hypothetical protein B5G46_03635 [Elizabethkingia meningoseptica]EJK5328682.1 hypothetical protein [Elizabethkingia meningoseptica]EOR31609.1 hypothetical protein L100_01200 [Elizabethkingia meningoseptica ATCC 13253 = NBRC 12535]
MKNLYFFRSKGFRNALFLTAIGISILVSAKRVATWTSTCGILHRVEFSDSWTNTKIAAYVASINSMECGEIPVVIINQR